MPPAISSVMTSDPACCDAGATLVDAAKLMDERDIGDVLVMEDDHLRGIVTDRDITVRAVARGADPSATTLGDICSDDVVTLTPDQTVADAIEKMRDRAIRRIPVVEDGKPVGIVSIGDLAETDDQRSLLGAISSAPPND